MGRKWFKPEEKMAVLREVLIKKTPISEVCKAYKIQPSVYYSWQKQLMEDGAIALDKKGSSKQENQAVAALNAKNVELENTLRARESALAELLQEHVKLKKRVIGEI